MNKICNYCNKPFKTTNSSKGCSDECKKLYRLEYHKQRNILLKSEYSIQCIICNVVFISTHPNTKTCCKKCRDKNNSNLRKKGSEKYRKSEKGKYAKKRSYFKNGKVQKKLKHRVKNGIIDNSITLKRLIIRDNNICHICNKECNLNDYTTISGTKICGNTYPSIDHVNPLSKGGTHSWDNVSLAHRICNSLKSDN